MRRSTFALALLVVGCGDSGGEGGGSSWQPGLNHVPDEDDGDDVASSSYTTPYAASGGGCTGTVGAPCECPGGYEGEYVCAGDGGYCSCPIGACGTDFEGDDDYCLETHCCDAIRSCAHDDQHECYECLYAGGGDRCDGLIACGVEFDCEFTRIARLCRTTGIRYDVHNPTDRCIAANCCSEVVECVARRGESGCEACIRTGSEDPECDPILECMAANGCSDDGGGGGGGAGGSGGAGSTSRGGGEGGA